MKIAFDLELLILKSHIQIYECVHLYIDIIIVYHNTKIKKMISLVKRKKVTFLKK